MDQPLQYITQLIARAAAERTARADKQTAFAEIVQRFQDLAFGSAVAVLEISTWPRRRGGSFSERCRSSTSCANRKRSLAGSNVLSLPSATA